MKLLKIPSPLSASKDILHLIFPKLCLACERELAPSEQHLCSFCTVELTPTRYHRSPESTPMDQLFWGRAPVQSTYAHYYFEKKKAVQDLLYALKYRNDAQIGVYYGQEMGRQLLETEMAGADVIIPVPLHPRKEFLRGYNQSSYLAKGIAEPLALPVDEKVVRRIRHTVSQTRKSRFQRWDNVSGIFQVLQQIENYRHVILVDDVITTGSTLESLIIALREKKPELLVSVATLATA